MQATADGGIGGNGGTAGNPHVGPIDARGGDAGVGGNGGTANVLLSGGTITVNQTPWISANSTGIRVDANGGDGGAGGMTLEAIDTMAGDGGTGGSGGTASATILGTVILNGSAGVDQTSGQAVFIQANGGGGGQGGDANAGIETPGGGGFAGAGGSATLTLGNATTPGTLRTTGNFGHGAVVQSVGGGGGNGGSAGFFGTGGAGAAGGDGGQVTVNAPKASTVATSVFVTGTNSIALLAQSVGGGGGVGGDATGLAIGGGVAIGGNGGHGRQWRHGHAEPGGGRVRFDQPAWRRRRPGAEHRRFGRRRRQCHPQGHRTVLADDRRRRGHGWCWRPGECQQLGIDHQLR